MKLITFAIPCYNSAEYMENCVNSILPAGEDVEIIIVDDGSVKDNTAEIADRLAAEHPSIIRAIHQENGGHGEAVNTGIANATGIFFKVVDSDDWVDAEALPKVIEVLKKSVEEGHNLDMLISNYIYDKVGQTHKKVMRYPNLPTGRYFDWSETKRFKKGQYILMHSVIYRTKLLRDCGIKLPKHTFYVDNLYVFNPMPYVKDIYYLDENFYHYFIGREDQSVNEQIMISRIDQQIRVNKLMVDEFLKIPAKTDKHTRKYMFNYLEVITVVSTVLMIKSGTEENRKKRIELWNYIKNASPALYNKIRYGFLAGATNLPGKGGRLVCVASYKLSQKIVGFN